MYHHFSIPRFHSLNFPQVLLKSSYYAAIGTYSAILLLCCIAALLLPIETKGRALEVWVTFTFLSLFTFNPHFGKSIFIGFPVQVSVHPYMYHQYSSKGAAPFYSLVLLLLPIFPINLFLIPVPENTTVSCLMSHVHSRYICTLSLQWGLLRGNS